MPRRLPPPALPWLLLCLVALAATGAHAGSPSSIELRVDLPLAPLAAELDRRLPTHLDHWGSWTRYRGVDVRYQVRRGAVRLAMQGDTLHLTVPLAYRVKARKKLLGRLDLSGDCGVDEPPREVLIRIASRLAWRPDWRLGAHSVVYPPAFRNPCRMTIARLDVTPLIRRRLQRELVRVVGERVDAALPQLTDLRPQAELAWRALRQPIALGPDKSAASDENLWLRINPEAVAVTPFQGRGQRVSVVLSLAVRPEVVAGERPPAEGTALPHLALRRPGPDRIQVQVSAALGLEEAARHLRERLAADPPEVMGARLAVSDARISAVGERLAVTLTLTEPLAGTLRISGRPAYAEDDNAVYLADPHTDLDTDSPLAAAAGSALVQAAVASARWSLDGPTEGLRQRLEQALNRRLAGDAHLRTRVGEVRIERIALTPTTMEAQASVSGRAELRLH